jgi:hypothetical protein
MDPNQTARMRRLVWIHAGRKPIMLVLSWRGSFINFVSTLLDDKRSYTKLYGKARTLNCASMHEVYMKIYHFQTSVKIYTDTQHVLVAVAGFMTSLSFQQPVVISCKLYI